MIPGGAFSLRVDPQNASQYGRIEGSAQHNCSAGPSANQSALVQGVTAEDADGKYNMLSIEPFTP